MEKTNVWVTLGHVSCFRCHGVFGMVDVRGYKNSHENFFCPYCGQRQYYSGKSEEEKLREETVRLARLVELSEHRLETTRKWAKREAAALKGQRTKLTKKLNRVASGVCPCCNRTFQNLAKHMQTQHNGVSA